MRLEHSAKSAGPMIERIIDISEEPASLAARYECLVIKKDGIEAARIPFGEIAVVVGANSRINYTHSALSGMAENGVILVIAGKNFIPAGMMIPMVGNYIQAERFARQAAMKEPAKKRLWQEIIRGKIKSQSSLVKSLHKKDEGLGALVKMVKSGDTSNVEARASRKYWPLLFGDKNFRRRRDAEDQNRMLNYGYSVLLAIVCRAICSAGLHPSFGLHHHNRYNPYCLASDMMEPFRALVDRKVFEITRERGGEAPLDKDAKREIISALTGRFVKGDEQRTLFDVCSITASRLVGVIEGRERKLGLLDISYE